MAQSISEYEALLLFTQAERIAIRSSTDPAVIDLLNLLEASGRSNVPVDFTAGKTFDQGLDYLVSKSLLTQTRKDAIMGSGG